MGCMYPQMHDTADITAMKIPAVLCFHMDEHTGPGRMKLQAGLMSPKNSQALLAGCAMGSDGDHRCMILHDTTEAQYSHPGMAKQWLASLKMLL